MKNDIAKRYRTRFIINLIIAAFITCLIESLLIFNIGRLVLVFGKSFEQSSIYALFYVVSAVFIFALVFYLLQLRSINYINDLSRAMADMADGKLDTRVRVEGDDEFSQMAENLNNLGEDLEKLLEVEREAEKSKTDLI
ncbi:MAG: HAMP domain-containing protein, partial [Lachnospiraceae bacterium]|nr:HAMP domain-containing protein [Lachnospiraceae bacterium]